MGNLKAFPFYSPLIFKESQKELQRIGVGTNRIIAQTLLRGKEHKEVIRQHH